ncbi:MAG: DNA alkylation repair protein [Chloroflexi bacterium]|nr:DNA alkylation repair protein [Chloroflexota bacterium]
MASVQDVLRMLQSHAHPDNVEGMARFGMTPDARLGVSVPDMRRIAKSIGRDHALALALWETGIPEARILASMVDDPAQLTDSQMEAWVADFNSWDVCDQVCMNLFDKSPLAWQKVGEWAQRDEEFVRRAAFALIACLAWHDKAAPDEAFIRLFPVIKAGATDGRNFVKKAASWALRQVGKRNANLRRAALDTAREIGQMDAKPARWIAADVIRELEKT